MYRKYMISGTVGLILFITLFILGVKFISDNQNSSTVNLNIGIKNGEVLEIKESEDEQTLSIKVKIKEQDKSEDTINQNLDNIQTIIESVNTDKYKNLYYYAVADICNKKDIPIISLTLSKNDIENLKGGVYEYKQALALADDLWIYPTLAKDSDNEESNEVSSIEQNKKSSNSYKPNKSSSSYSSNTSNIKKESREYVSSKNKKNNINSNTNDDNANNDNQSSPSDNIIDDNNFFYDDDIILDGGYSFYKEVYSGY